MSSLPKRPKRPHITEGHRAMTAVIALSLAAVGTAIYLSPTSAQSAAGAATAVQSTPSATPPWSSTARSRTESRSTGHPRGHLKSPSPACGGGLGWGPGCLMTPSL